MTDFLKIWVYHLVSAFLSAAVGYAVLNELRDGCVFGALYRMYCYHEAHPLQYIGVVALVYSVIATPLAFRFGKLEGWRRKLVIMGVIVVSVVVASVPGGMLWAIHDMQAGYFPQGALFWRHLLCGAWNGATIGLFVILFSFPYNLIGVICGYLITNHGFKLASERFKSSPKVSHA